MQEYHPALEAVGLMSQVEEVNFERVQGHQGAIDSHIQELETVHRFLSFISDDYAKNMEVDLERDLEGQKILQELLSNERVAYIFQNGKFKWRGEEELKTLAANVAQIPEIMGELVGDKERVHEMMMGHANRVVTPGMNLEMTKLSHTMDKGTQATQIFAMILDQVKQFNHTLDRNMGRG